jgi:flagellar protein FliO/FliZ
MRPRTSRHLACSWLLALSVGFHCCAAPASVRAQQPPPRTSMPPLISSGAPQAAVTATPLPNNPLPNNPLPYNPSPNSWSSPDQAWITDPSAPPTAAARESLPSLPAALQQPVQAQHAPSQSLPSQPVQPAQFLQATASPRSSANPSSANPSSANPSSANPSSGSQGAMPLKPPTQAASAGLPSQGGSTLRMLVSLGSSLLIVLGLVLGAAWCYRNANPHARSSLPKLAVSVLGRTSVAPRQQLMLIRFGNKLILVNNLQGEMRTLSEIDDPLEVDRLSGLCESDQAGSVSASFRSVLHNLGRAS